VDESVCAAGTRERTAVAMVAADRAGTHATHAAVERAAALGLNAAGANPAKCTDILNDV